MQGMAHDGDSSVLGLGLWINYEPRECADVS